MQPDILKEQGWIQLESSGFTEVSGPYWIKGNDPQSALAGLLVEKKHSNHIDRAHGGALMPLADVSLGRAVVLTLGSPSCVTAQLQMQYVSTAKVGEFICCTPEIIRQTQDLFFMRGLLTVDDRVIASAEGIWKVLQRR